jgi:hypothetical protein
MPDRKSPRVAYRVLFQRVKPSPDPFAAPQFALIISAFNDEDANREAKRKEATFKGEFLIADIRRNGSSQPSSPPPAGPPGSS